jgi:hypothetical protein
MKGYRQRQDRARTLQAEGRTPEPITEEPGADFGMVKKWISSTKKG